MSNGSSLLDVGAAPEAVEKQREWNAAVAAADPQSFWRETGRAFLRHRTGMVSAIVLVLLVLGSVFAPWISPYDPLVGVPADRLHHVFSAGHVLGTDEQGRDVLSRILYGGRLSLLAGFVPTIVATVLGTVIGVVSGMTGGLLAVALMRFMDMLYGFPAVLLAIAVGAALGPGLANTIIAVSVVFVPPVARVAEGATRRVVLQEYVEAARLTGASRWRIARSQILPNVLSDIVVYASGLVGVAMIIAASLSFLGLGSLPPNPEWGYMLNSLRGAIYVVPDVVVVPGVFIFIASVAFNLTSDGLRESMDTKR